MKKLLLSFGLLGALTAHSQGYIAPELGASSKGTWYTSMKGGYQMKHLFTEGMILAQMDRKNAAYFAISAGYSLQAGFISIEPAIGLGYRLISADKTILNGFVPFTSVKFRLNNDVYFSLMYTDKTWMAGIGLKCTLKGGAQ